MTTIAKVVIFVVIIGLVSAGAYYYDKNQKDQKASNADEILSKESVAANIESENTEDDKTKNATKENDSPTESSDNATKSTTKDGDITIGLVPQVEVAKVQANVNAGNQPWRTDPMQVTQADSGEFGFTVIDQFELIETTTNSSKIRAKHQGANYIIELNKPADTGPSGIWVIYKIIKEKI